MPMYATVLECFEAGEEDGSPVSRDSVVKDVEFEVFEGPRTLLFAPSGAMSEAELVLLLRVAESFVKGRYTRCSSDV